MRDNLPKKPFQVECGIINLDESSGNGTHWTAYYKEFNKVLYFDSFGNLQPPKEVIIYLGSNIKFNYEAYQDYNTFICGHLCLLFLYECCGSK